MQPASAACAGNVSHQPGLATRPRVLLDESLHGRRRDDEVAKAEGEGGDQSSAPRGARLAYPSPGPTVRRSSAVGMTVTLSARHNGWCPASRGRRRPAGVPRICCTGRSAAHPRVRCRRRCARALVADKGDHLGLGHARERGHREGRREGRAQHRIRGDRRTPSFRSGNGFPPSVPRAIVDAMESAPHAGLRQQEDVASRKVDGLVRRLRVRHVARRRAPVRAVDVTDGEIERD